MGCRNYPARSGTHVSSRQRRERERQDAGFLIKGHDEHERPGADALTLETQIPFCPPGQATADVDFRRELTRFSTEN